MVGDDAEADLGAGAIESGLNRVLVVREYSGFPTYVSGLGRLGLSYFSALF